MCIDGIEVANNCRTRAYLRNVGHPMLDPASWARLASASDDDCCCGQGECPDWDLTVVLSFPPPEDPVDLCRTITLPAAGPWNAVVYNYPWGDLFECGGPRPDLPPDDDPSWNEVGAFVGITDLEGPPLAMCSPLADLPDEGCGFNRWEFTHVPTGRTFTTYEWFDFTSIFPIPGTAAVGLKDREGEVLWASGTVGTSFPGECGFTTPEGDDAPWYDPAVPESADVLGVWVESLVVSNPFRRTVRDRWWGTSLGAPRWVGRELVMSGIVLARGEKATEYARQWLFEAVQGGCVTGPCGLPDGVIYKTCDEDSVRTLKRVGLADNGFQWTQNDRDLPVCAGAKFEVTLRSESPFMYHDPVEGYIGPVVLDGAVPFCNICSACPPLAGSDPLVCGCLDAPARVVPPRAPDGCFCLPVTAYRLTAAVEAPALWTDATAIIRVNAGWEVDPADPGIRNLRIRAWPNPMGYEEEPAEGHFDCIPPCLEIDVSCIPRGASLVIDGTTRRATIEGQGRVVNGYPYLSSDGGQGALAWPDVGCDGLFLMIDADATEGHTAPDSTLEFHVVGQDRG